MKKRSLAKKMMAPVLGLALLVPAAFPSAAFASDDAKVKSVEFVGMDAPKTAAAMAKDYTTASVKVTYTDGSTKTYPLSYKTLFKSTDKFNGVQAGTPIDVNGKPIMDNSVPGHPVAYVSDAPDSNDLIKAKGSKNLNLLTHFEYITADNAGNGTYGLIPASMANSTIEQNKFTGDLKVTNVSKVDFSSVDGLWIPCNGSQTPWGTHLSSEEYEANARAYEADPTKTYLGSFTKLYFQDDKKVGNPYAYGYIPEVTVNKDGSTSVVKHYSMGRFSHELGKVAPDRKTVFFGDDGGNTMMFLYVADKAEDLSAGTLYAAKWVQTGTANGGSANLEWIKLGHATDAEIKTYIDKGLKFSDMFETSDKAADGFTAIKTYPSETVEYLKVKPGMEKAAAFLESRRYGAILGATAEFNKMEGVTVNAKDNKMYLAMTAIKGAMEKDGKGQDPADHIQLPKILAGVTYELSLNGGQTDNSKQSIASEYVPSKMNGLVVGEDLAAPDALGNTANPDKVANTDNLSFSEDMRTLFIGEDSGMHTNNFVWAYNVDTKKLSRILSVPAGAEATGLQAVDNMSGFNYIMSNFQHAGDELAKNSMPEDLKKQVLAEIDKAYDNKKAGNVGYISGLPRMSKNVEWQHEEGSKKVILRDIVEKMGAKLKWNDADWSLEVTTKNGKVLKAKIDSNEVVVDGVVIKLPEAVKLENDRTVIPSDVLDAYLAE